MPPAGLGRRSCKGDNELTSARVLYVMAAEAEYGARLRARIKPLITGVGPVEAAISTTMTLFAYESEGERPDLIVSLGSAGSATLEQGRVYQVSSVSWRDMDASALGFERGTTPFVEEAADVAMPTPLLDVPKARLSTGANVVSGEAYADIDADMVDMETHAVRRAARRFGVPVVGLRGVSDGAEELRRYADWSETLPVVDARLAEAVDALAGALAGGLLERRGDDVPAEPSPGSDEGSFRR